MEDDLDEDFEKLITNIKANAINFTENGKCIFKGN